MATAAAAALRHFFPTSLRGCDYPGGPDSAIGLVTLSSRRRHCAAAVATPSQRGAEPSSSSSLGHLTRADFPILHLEFDGNKLIYFDNGATSQKPSSVIKTLDEYYRSYNSNVHRGIHALSSKATDAYETARTKVANFVNAADSREIIFTRNATEAINLVAYSWGLSNINQGDEIILTVAEHHSAIVPWQFVSQKTGATLKYVRLTKEGVPDIDQLKGFLSNKTKIVVVHHVSNVLGSMLPIEKIVTWSHKVGARVLVDACQSVPHMTVDVQKLGADFLVASSHKMCGPTGVGFLHGKFEILASMEPFLGGGEMIADVYEEKSTYAELPSRKSWQHISTKTSFLFQMSGSMVRPLHRMVIVPLYFLSMLRMFILQILQKFLICSMELRFGRGIIAHRFCTGLLALMPVLVCLHFYNTKEEVDVFIHALKDTIDFLTSQL